jgi:hypothetical protein
MYEQKRVGKNVTDFAAYGLSDLAAGLPKRDGGNKANTNPLADHPAVTGYRAVGVSTQDLVSFIESFASLRASRVKSVGHSQYAIAQGQKFESFTPSDTIRELNEELADASNYIDFLAIKLLNLAHIMEVGLPDCD